MTYPSLTLPHLRHPTLTTSRSRWITPTPQSLIPSRRRGHPKIICGGIKKRCGDPDCGFRFDKQYTNELYCPCCGLKRYPCTIPVSRNSPPKAKCRFHGGASLSGRGVKHLFKHGRSSRKLPPNILDNYERAQSDPQLKSLEQDMVLAEVRIQQLIDRLDGEEVFARWKDARKCCDKVESAWKSEDTGKLHEALDGLVAVIKSVEKDNEIWAELRETINFKRTLGQDEHRRQLELQQSITSEQAQLLVHQMILAIDDAVGEHIARFCPDAEINPGEKLECTTGELHRGSKALLSRIGERFNQLMTAPGLTRVAEDMARKQDALEVGVVGGGEGAEEDEIEHESCGEDGE